MIVGTEWLIEAAGCDPAALRDQDVLMSILSSVIDDLGLRSVGSVWHKFDGEGGVTGLVALTESHLACHTYPEYGAATFNLYCCRTRPEWDWDTPLKSRVGATTVTVRKVERGTGESEISDLTVAGFGNTRLSVGREFEIAGGTK